MPIEDCLHADILAVMEGNTIEEQFVWFSGRSYRKGFATNSKGKM